MAIVSDTTLKSFFQSGDKPTQSQFEALIDSMVNKVDDYELLGLHTYDEKRVYKQDDTSVYQNELYICTAIQTSGSFNTNDWKLISNYNSDFGQKENDKETANNTTKFSNALTYRFTPSTSGLYRIEWYFELGAKTIDSTVSAQVKEGGTVIGSSVIKVSGITPNFYYSFSGFKVLSLDKEKAKDILIDFKKNDSESGESQIRRIRVSVSKV